MLGRRSKGIGLSISLCLLIFTWGCEPKTSDSPAFKGPTALNPKASVSKPCKPDEFKEALAKKEGSIGTNRSPLSAETSRMLKGPAKGQTEFTYQSLERNGCPKRWKYKTPGKEMLPGGSFTPPYFEPLGTIVSGKREPQEADLYKVVGDKLFFLSSFKGLVIFSLKEPKAPKKISSLEIYGRPVEMFVSQTYILVLVNAYLRFRQMDGRFSFKVTSHAELINIDIRDINKPKIIQRFSLEGEVQAGASRKRGKRLYIVSNRPRSSFHERDGIKKLVVAHTFDTSEPQRLQLLKAQDLLAEHTALQSRNALYRVVITSTMDFLLISTVWYQETAERVGPCSVQLRGKRTLVTIMDIRSAKLPEVHSHFWMSGQLPDQFKQSIIYDAKKQKHIYLGIVQRDRVFFGKNSWVLGDRTNLLRTYALQKGQSPILLGKVAFGKKDESLFGSRFDLKRKLVYVITAKRQDPLYAISFKDPEKPRIRSLIDGLNGDVNLFRLLEDGKYLLAVGRDNSQLCSGFGAGTASTRVAVSLFDVRDTDAIRLIQRKCVLIQGASWIGSEVNRNLGQAHKMIALHQIGKRYIVTVPVYYRTPRKEGRFGGRYETGVGMMEWDFSAYDPAKNERQQKVLHTLPHMRHTSGVVKRTLFVPSLNAQDAVIINLSNSHLSTFALNKNKTVVPLANVDIAAQVNQIFKVGNVFVEHIVYGDSGKTYHHAGSNEFRIRSLETKAKDRTILASLRFGQIEGFLPWKSLLVIFRRRDHRQSEILIYDLARPEQPKKLKTLVLPFGVKTYYWWDAFPKGDITKARSNRAHHFPVWWTRTAEGFAFLGHIENWGSPR